MRGLLAVFLLAAIQTPTRHWRELLVVHGDDVRTEHLETLTRRRNVTRLAASKVARGDLARGNVMLAGTPQSNRFIRELAPDAFAEWYDRPGHVVQIGQPNPLNPEYRMSLVVGKIDRPVGRRRADVHIRYNGRTILLAFARDDATFETRRFEIADQPQLALGGFRFFVHGFEAELDELRHLVVEDQHADVHLYRSLEEKGLITDDTRSAHVEDGVFHIVLGVDERPARFIAENLVDETARRVLSTMNPPSLAELVDDERFLDERTLDRFDDDAAPLLVRRGLAAVDVYGRRS